MNITVIKIGGAVVENAALLELALEQTARFEYPILVHGGGRIATHLAEQLGIESRLIEGRRVTDAAMMQVALMTYAGALNKRIVARFNTQIQGRRAVGLSGVDGALLPAHRRSQGAVDYGFVGDPINSQVNAEFLKLLLMSGYVPVICSISFDVQLGDPLNTNADSVAQSIACGLVDVGAVTLKYCFDKPGVLRDQNDPNTLISQIRPSDFEPLCREGVISEGMIPKVKNALDAIAAGVQGVWITSVAELGTPERGTIVGL